MVCAGFIPGTDGSITAVSTTGCHIQCLDGRFNGREKGLGLLVSVFIYCESTVYVCHLGVNNLVYF